MKRSVTIKRRKDTHIPGGFQVNNGNPQGNSGAPPQSEKGGVDADNAVQDVTLEVLRENVARIQLQLAVIVEWLETIDGRLDTIDERLEQEF